MSGSADKWLGSDGGGEWRGCGGYWHGGGGGEWRGGGEGEWRSGGWHHGHGWWESRPQEVPDPDEAMAPPPIDTAQAQAQKKSKKSRNKQCVAATAAAIVGYHVGAAAASSGGLPQTGVVAAGASWYAEGPSIDGVYIGTHDSQ